jgi:hypothetical protein
MKTYEYKDGSKIEVELVEIPPNVVYAMGECHVGDCWTAKLFHATTSNGRTAQFDEWVEAKQFLSDNKEIVNQKKELTN